MKCCEKTRQRILTEHPTEGRRFQSKLSVFLYYHWWRCTFDWEVMGVHNDTLHLLAGKKKLKDEYKDPDIWPKVNKAHMAAMMESNEKYIKSCYGVVRVPLAYVIRKTMNFQTYGDYTKYATSDDKMIARRLHLPQTRIDCTMSRVLSQSERVHQNIR